MAGCDQKEKVREKVVHSPKGLDHLEGSDIR